MRDDDNIDYRAVTLAVLVSLGLHLVLLWLIPPTFQQKFSLSQQPVEVITTPIKVEEARLPLKMSASRDQIIAAAWPPSGSSTSASAAKPPPSSMRSGRSRSGGS